MKASLQWFDLPSVTIEFTTLVDAENEVHFFARAEGLIQDALVVFLSGPQTFLDTEVQIKLEVKYISYIIKIAHKSLLPT